MHLKGSGITRQELAREVFTTANHHRQLKSCYRQLKSCCGIERAHRVKKGLSGYAAEAEKTEIKGSS